MAIPIDLSGQKFGKLYIESIAFVKKYDKYYNCICDCGTRKVILGANIKSGKIKSCGCLRHKTAPNYRNRTGEKYGKLTCIRPEKRGEYVYWLCKCECGKETWVRGINLTTGAVKSCGCIIGESNRVHGMSHTRIHGIWSKMIERCNNPNCKQYRYYGAEGKKVCDEWLGTEGFIRFYEWAKANGYSEDLTIERKNVNLGYSPENCCWIPRNEQSNNTRKTVRIFFNNKEYTLKELSEEYGVKKENIVNRLKLGWTLEEVLEIEKRDRKRKIRA